MSIWNTATGRKIPFNDLDHQHLSNIIWFYELLHNYEFKEMRDLLNQRFDGVLLDFKPLPIPNELRALHLKGMLTNNGLIIKRIGFNKYAVVGSVTHIEGWYEMIKG